MTPGTNTTKRAAESIGWLPDMDLNHDKQIQSLLCYRYTIGQCNEVRILEVKNWKSSLGFLLNLFSRLFGRWYPGKIRETRTQFDSIGFLTFSKGLEMSPCKTVGLGLLAALTLTGCAAPSSSRSTNLDSPDSSQTTGTLLAYSPDKSKQSHRLTTSRSSSGSSNRSTIESVKSDSRTVQISGTKGTRFQCSEVIFGQCITREYRVPQVLQVSNSGSKLAIQHADQRGEIIIAIARAGDNPLTAVLRQPASCGDVVIHGDQVQLYITQSCNQVRVRSAL